MDYFLLIYSAFHVTEVSTSFANTKSVEHRLHIRTGKRQEARGKRQEAKGGIDNQSLITGFSITKGLSPLPIPHSDENCYTQWVRLF